MQVNSANPIYSDLSDPKRRKLLFRLLRHPTTTLSLENDDEVAEWYHIHLPMLREDGIIEYEETGVRIDVHRGEEWSEYEETIEAVRDACQRKTM